MEKQSLFLIITQLLFCVSTAKKPFIADEILSFENGKTRANDVIQIYGEPQKITISGETLNYCYLNKTDIAYELLLLQFNRQKVLTSRHYRDAESAYICGSVVPKTKARFLGVNNETGSGVEISSY